MITRLALILPITIAASAHAQQSQTKWPVKDGAYVIQNFHFGTGESLAELRLHYLTLGGKSHQRMPSPIDTVRESQATRPSKVARVSVTW